MRKWILLLAAAWPAMASTHIVDTLYLADGVTPAPCGRIFVQGYQRDANGKTALSGSVTVPIQPGGKVDFYLEGGSSTSFKATVYLFQMDCKTQASSYQEPPWAVPITTSTVTIRQIRGTAVTPSQQVALGQLNPAGFTNGQMIGYVDGGFAPVPPVSYSATFNVPSETAGTVAVTNGSTDITGIGTSWTADMNGRQMMVDQCATGYRFTYVSATSGTLEAPYDCPTRDASPATLTGSVSEPFVITSGLNDTVQLRINDAVDVNATLTASTPASITGSVSEPFAISAGVNDALQLRIDDAVDVAVTLTAGDALTAGQVAADIQDALTAAGAAAVAEAYGLVVRIRSTTPAGTVSSIEIQAGTANDTLGLTAMAASGGAGRTAAQAAADIQAALTAASAPATAEASGGHVVVRSTTPVGTISHIEVKSSGSANATLGIAPGILGGGSGAGYQLNQSVRIPGATHRLATADFSVQCFDGTTGTPIADVAAITIDPASYDVEATFWTAHAGRCELHR